MGIQVLDKISCLDLFFWMMTKDGDENKAPVIRPALKDTRTSVLMNDSFENAKILTTQR